MNAQVLENSEENHTKLTSRALEQRQFYAFLFALRHCRIHRLCPSRTTARYAIAHHRAAFPVALVSISPPERYNRLAYYANRDVHEHKSPYMW